MTDAGLPPFDNSQPPKIPPAAPPSVTAAAPQAVFDPQLFPPRHRPLRQMLMDHNPFLLLSTVCMLLGCYLVNSALYGQPSNIKLMALLGVINLYEFCIIPLGLVLIRLTRGIARDAWWLLLFETLFLVNATFINPDFSPAWSIPLNLVLFVLASIKAGVIMQGLKINLSLRTYGFFVLQLAIIYCIPILYALVQKDGVVPPRIMYGLWWLVGLLPLVYDQIARNDRRPQQWDVVQQVIRRVYLIAPWVMLVIHLGFSHWAHNTDFHVANVAPILLGLAIASTRLRLGSNLRFCARAFPALAVALSLLAPAGQLQWVVDITGEAHHVLPAHFAVVGSILTYGYMATLFHLLGAMLAVSLMGTGYVFQAWIMAAMRQVVRFLGQLVPTTVIAWGVTAIVAAFVLLGVGSYFSLRRTAVSTPRTKL